MNNIWFKKTFQGPFSAVSVCLLAGCTIQGDPIDANTQRQYLQDNLQTIFQQQPNMPTSIALDEAIARTVKFNLQERVTNMELALSVGQLSMAKLDMLPQITAGAVSSHRNNSPSEQIVDADNNPTSQLTSTPKDIYAVNAQVQWSLLDFGLSYVRAKQQANQLMVLREERRKLTQALVQEATLAYWEAYDAQEMLPKINAYAEKVNFALNHYDENTHASQGEPDEQLRYQEAIVSDMRKLFVYKNKLVQAKQKLSTLMNLPVDAEYSLQMPNQSLEQMPDINVPVSKLDALALSYRPELLELGYQVRIAKLGVTKAILEMLPNLGLSGSANYNSNEFLLHSGWLDGSVSATWNLLKLVSGPRARALALTEVDLEKIRETAMTMTVLTEIRIGLSLYNAQKEDYVYALKEKEISNQIYQGVLGAENEAMSTTQEQTNLRNGLVALIAELEARYSFYQTQAALGRLYRSIGFYLLPEGVDREDDLGLLTVLVRDRLEETIEPGFDTVVRKAYNKLLDPDVLPTDPVLVRNSEDIVIAVDHSGVPSANTDYQEVDANTELDLALEESLSRRDGSEELTSSISSFDRVSQEKSHFSNTAISAEPEVKPLATNDIYTVNADETLIIPLAKGVLINDDLGNSHTTVMSYDKQSVNGGTAWMDNLGSFGYIPAYNFNGIDSFNYTIQNARGETSTATVVVNVNSPTQATDSPVMANTVNRDYEFIATFRNILQEGNIEEEIINALLEDMPSNPSGRTQVKADLLTENADNTEMSKPIANDDFYETFEEISTNGEMIKMSDTGSFSYLPVSNFTGADSFAYYVNDGSIGTVTIKVHKAEEADTTVATEDSNAMELAELKAEMGADTAQVKKIHYKVQKGSELVVTFLSGLLSNVDNRFSDTLEVELNKGPVNGALTLNRDGSFMYEPNDDYFGTDSFSYNVNNYTLGVEGELAMVLIEVEPVDEELLADASVAEVITENVTSTAAENHNLVTALTAEKPNVELKLNKDGSLTYGENETVIGMYSLKNRYAEERLKAKTEAASSSIRDFTF